MRRHLVPISFLLVAAAGCRDYERYGYVASQKGLIPADSFARYGTDQAIATAVGREYGKAHSGSSAADYGRQAETAVAYGRKFSQVRNIAVDSLGFRLVITFADGWTSQVTPITDGKSGDDTPGLPKGK